VFGSPKAKMLNRLKVTPKSGNEAFHADGTAAGFDLLEFWRLSGSDLVGNATRGLLAEFLVAKALGIPTSGVRAEWVAFDLETPDGLKIEVKSAAYLQSWAQSRPSSIQFSVRPARSWDPETNEVAGAPTRVADLYVFALLAHRDKASLDPLNLDQWRFYVLPTSRLNEHAPSQRTLSLGRLELLAGTAVSFGQLRSAVNSTRGAA